MKVFIKIFCLFVTVAMASACGGPVRFGGETRVSPTSKDLRTNVDSSTSGSDDSIGKPYHEVIAEGELSSQSETSSTDSANGGQAPSLAGEGVAITGEAPVTVPNRTPGSSSGSKDANKPNDNASGAAGKPDDQTSDHENDIANNGAKAGPGSDDTDGNQGRDGICLQPMPTVGDPRQCPASVRSPNNAFCRNQDPLSVQCVADVEKCQCAEAFQCAEYELTVQDPDCLVLMSADIKAFFDFICIEQKSLINPSCF